MDYEEYFSSVKSYIDTNILSYTSNVNIIIKCNTIKDELCFSEDHEIFNMAAELSSSLDVNSEDHIRCFGLVDLCGTIFDIWDDDSEVFKGVMKNLIG